MKNKEIKAPHGEKMIEIQVRFWTDGVSRKKGYVVPKNCLAMGVVKLQTNESHGIRQKNPVPFNSLLDLTATIEKVLIQNEIILHKSNKMHKYIK